MVMLRLCPLKHKQEGTQRAAPGPGSHRWPLWPVIMGSVAPSYPQHIIRAKHHQGHQSVCAPLCTSSQLSTHASLLTQQLTAGKKVCSSKSAGNGSTRVMIYEDVLAQKTPEINTICTLTKGTGVFSVGRNIKGSLQDGRSVHAEVRRKTREEADIFNSGAIHVKPTVPPPQGPWEEGLTSSSSPLCSVTGVSTASVSSWTF